MGKISYLMMVHREAIMYVIMGGFTTLVTWASYAGFVHFGVSEEVSNVLSWVCVVVFAFIANNCIVFNSTTLQPDEEEPLIRVFPPLQMDNRPLLCFPIAFLCVLCTRSA